MTSSLLSAPPAVDRGPATAPPRLRRVSYEPEPDPDLRPERRPRAVPHPPAPPQPVRPHPVPAHPAPGHSGPGHSAPTHSGSAHAGPAHPGPGHSGPGHSGPGQSGPGHSAPGHPGPGYPGPGCPGPAAAQLGQPVPGRTAADLERAERADAHGSAARFLRLALEVFDGNRPAAHIAGRASPSVLRYWQVATQRRKPRTAARFSRLRLCLPRSGVAEVAVTCEIDGRARALAARFERSRSGWRCTALRLG